MITGLATGGAERALLKLLAGSAGLRDTARVLSLRDRGTVGPEIEALGVPVGAIGIRRSLPGAGAIRRFRWAVRAEPPAIVHGWMYHGNLAASYAARALPARPAVVWNVQHSVYSLTDEKPLTALVIRAGAWLSRSADRIVYNSRAAAQQHERLGYAADRTVILPNGFDTTRFAPSPEHRARLREALGIPADALVVGLLGRYHPMKDHRTFLRAAALLGARPEVRFLLAGPGVDPGNHVLAAEVAALGLGPRTLLLGARPDPERVMAALDILCSSSSSEGSPNVVGEAMSAGVPCVVTDVGDSAWLVADTGVVVPPRDPAALAAGLRSLLDSPQRVALGRRARERVVRAFALPAIAARYAALQAELLERA